jgi:hypothetical protein
MGSARSSAGECEARPPSSAPLPCHLAPAQSGIASAEQERHSRRLRVRRPRQCARHSCTTVWVPASRPCREHAGPLWHGTKGPSRTEAARSRCCRLRDRGRRGVCMSGAGRGTAVGKSVMSRSYQRSRTQTARNRRAIDSRAIALAAPARQRSTKQARSRSPSTAVT